uniref:DUF8204 domain-containing protein n=1 Tax=Aureoumbra lagunensis TaxID=44058 RepID=A0A7S3K270_9STRA|mmetsp:Transcript_18110/g.21955  ORF Transcript_18110/g.21955 Transcript_18110/m.21955 type:complete len:208 (-) Transcript_18110:48-671(-)
MSDMSENSSSSSGPNRKNKAKSCTGITYFSSAMKNEGKEALCLGRRGNVTSEIPQKDIIERSAKKNGKTEDEVDFSYACVGYSQTTEKMEKEGILPLCDVGMRFTILKAKNSQKQKEDVEESTQAIIKENSPPPVAGKPLSETLRPMMERYFQGASNFWRRALTDFPRKFYEFHPKFLASMKKQASYLGKLFSRFSKEIVSWWVPRS